MQQASWLGWHGRAIYGVIILSFVLPAWGKEPARCDAAGDFMNAAIALAGPANEALFGKRNYEN